LLHIQKGILFGTVWDVLSLDVIVKKFRSFSELKSESESKNFWNCIWNWSCRKKNLGVGEIGVVDKKNLEIGVEIGAVEKKISESESSFEIKKFDSAGH